MGGNRILVKPPVGFVLTCSMEGALRQISLPPKGVRPDCIDDPMEIRLASTLTAGQYAFAVTADLPTETPMDNTFNIIITDQDNNVVDAAYGIQGLPILGSLHVDAATLAWSKADMGQPTMITVGLTFVQDTRYIKALLITFPDMFL